MPTEPAPVLVLDTNVVLDWLVFANPQIRALGDAVAARRVRWVATAEMGAELQHVIARGRLARWQPDLATLNDAWARHCELVPAPTAPLARPRCSDADDQKFIDLAVARAARWLVTRDRALLKLARRLREAGVLVTTPERWTPQATAASR